MAAARLTGFLAQLPRLSLGTFPTPLVRLDRLSDRLAIDLWMKRDDCTGLALGGNKTRKLEFILADARARGARTIVTVGPLTSNHTMMTATAARREGFDVHCIVGGARPRDQRAWPANLVLLDYLGATLHFYDMDFSHPTPADGAAIQTLCDRVTAETRGYFVPGGGTMPQAEPGYMACVAEIAQQRGGVFDFDDVVLPFGTGSTTTGVLLGLALGEFAARVHPIAIETRYAVEECFRMKPPDELFRESAAFFRLAIDPSSLPPHAIVYGFADEGYSVPSSGADHAIRLVGQTEGYFLDPVYTGKAFFGMLELVRTGVIGQGRRVLFIHTGGLSTTPSSEKRFAHTEERYSPRATQA